ncbi:NADH-quinone oxidoreductase subunit K, partial [Vibrio cholerae]
LPQALILTAIVIGFGLLVLALMLFYRAYFETRSADVDEMRRSEEEE